MVRAQSIRVHSAPQDSPGRISEALRVKLLGGFRVSVGSRVIEDAKAIFQEALALFRELKNEEGVASSLYKLSAVCGLGQSELIAFCCHLR